MNAGDLRRADYGIWGAIIVVALPARLPNLL
jgi:hypothetical protein